MASTSESEATTSGSTLTSSAAETSTATETTSEQGTGSSTMASTSESEATTSGSTLTSSAAETSTATETTSEQGTGSSTMASTSESEATTSGSTLTSSAAETSTATETTSEQGTGSSTIVTDGSGVAFKASYDFTTIAATMLKRIVMDRISPPVKEGIHCLIVGDMNSFNDFPRKYSKEKDFINDVGEEFYNKTNNSSLGVVTYGSSKLPILHALNSMKKNFDTFSKAAALEMRARQAETSSSAEEAINRINGLKNLRNRANCLVFVSATNDTTRLPPLEPDKDWKRIVAVGFDGADLSKVVTPPRGVAVTVPYWVLEI
ncbi:unnamed protein product [Cylicocyclus nassatus]|uniref:Uncharacterized protein n=1 Tax=Cylicocyclus nassatus TaxID=53992 RepID=A0AA36M6E0_CYLNA|nr:unnamed protein product [Cylicocyclus nassatus]